MDICTLLYRKRVEDQKINNLLSYIVSLRPVGATHNPVYTGVHLLNKPLKHTRKANHIINLYACCIPAVGILLELGYMEISFLTSLHYCRREEKVNGVLSNKLSEGDLLRKIGAAQKLCRVSLGMVLEVANVHYVPECSPETLWYYSYWIGKADLHN